jgi:hypothetical protein
MLVPHPACNIAPDDPRIYHFSRFRGRIAMTDDGVSSRAVPIPRSAGARYNDGS